MPWFMEFQHKYGGKGLRSIGVAMDDGDPLERDEALAAPAPAPEDAAVIDHDGASVRNVGVDPTRERGQQVPV